MEPVVTSGKSGIPNDNDNDNDNKNKNENDNGNGNENDNNNKNENKNDVFGKEESGAFYKFVTPAFFFPKEINKNKIPPFQEMTFYFITNIPLFVFSPRFST